MYERVTCVGLTSYWNFVVLVNQEELYKHGSCLHVHTLKYAQLLVLCFLEYSCSSFASVDNESRCQKWQSMLLEHQWE